MTDIAVLFVEELRATMRGRFGWLGAGVVLLAIGALAAAATQDTWLDAYGIVAYGLVPMGFIPLAAGFIASPRANRFVESVFTAPVERHHWLAAKVLVLFTLAAGYYIALLPMQLVYTHHISMPFLLGRLLLWTPGVMVASIAIGTLIGVLFIGRSVAAPTAAGMGILLAYVGMVPLQELMVARGYGAGRSGHVMLASPPVLLKNALGFTVAAANIPATTGRTWLCLLFLVAGAMVLAAWIFSRAQGVETWEASSRQKWIITAALSALVLLPVAVADTNYDAPAPPPNAAPPLRGLFGRGVGNVAMVSPGGRLPVRCCSPLLNRETAALATDEPNVEDLLLLLPVESTEKVSGLQVEVRGEGGLQAASGAAPTLEQHAYTGDAGPAAADGHRLASGWIARVPVSLIPAKPWDIGGNRYALNITATYTTGSDPQRRTFSTRAAVEAGVASAVYEMAAVSAVLPLVCLGLAFARWRQTR